MSTLTQLRSAVAGKIGLDNSVSGDQTDIDRWINQGVNQVLIDTRCKVKSASFTPGALADWPLDSAILEIVTMYTTANSQNSPLERVSPETILAMRRANVSGSPTRYYALAGHDLVMFHPTPSATDTFTIYYVPVPTALSSGSDDPSGATTGGIPTQFHLAIEYWACAEAADYDDDQSSAQGQRYRDLYDAQIRKFKRFLRQRGGRRLGRASVARRGREYLPHDNSTYP